MYMHIVYIQYTFCEVLNEVPTKSAGDAQSFTLHTSDYSTCALPLLVRNERKRK